MSFILDALKKSESERQRQGGPALFEVKVAPPRHRIAPWVTLVAVLLAINLCVVGWLFLRSPSTRPPPTPVQTATPAAARAAAPEAASAAASPGIASPPAVPPTGTPPAAGSRATASHVAASRAAGGTPDAGTGASGSGDTNPADYEPAVEPPRGTPVQDGGGSVVRETDSGLPTYQEAAAAPGANLPSLRLDLHVYAAQPDQRFVFLNMTKLHEGESLPQGVRVDSITPDGVILSYRGEKFVLQR
ncbi:MAG: general secretion pathway protein GspB [Steroidobacteraceae bacterium]